MSRGIVAVGKAQICGLEFSVFETSQHTCGHRSDMQCYGSQSE